jgi:hypothetical protein
LLILALVAFAFWYGMRFARVRSKKNGEATIIEKAELEARAPLSEEGTKGLERRRVSELEWGEIMELAGDGVVEEREELNATVVTQDNGLGSVDIPVV